MLQPKTTFVIAALLLILNAGVMGAPQISLANVTCAPGAEVAMPLSIAGTAADLTYKGVNAKVVLPPGVTLKSVTEGILLPVGAFTIAYNAISEGDNTVATVVAYSGVNTFNGDGVLLTLTLGVPASATLGSNLPVIFGENNGILNAQDAVSDAEAHSIDLADPMAGSITIGESTLDISPPGVSVESSPGTTPPFTVTTPAAWTATSDSAWATVNSGSGTGTGSFTVTYMENPDTLSRTATITVTGTGTNPTMRQVKVIQNGSGGVEGDSDGDGLSDAWELEYFGDINQGPNDDFDGDGLSNGEERDQGFNPALFVGDVDGDKTITAGDATRVLQIIVGLRETGTLLDWADTNHDGAITAGDATRILQIVAEMRTITSIQR